FCFFFQAEDGIRDFHVTGVQDVCSSDLAVVPTRRGLARQCLDCTERRHHLGGPLGVALLAALCEQQVLRRAPDSRAIRVTPRAEIGRASCRERGESAAVARGGQEKGGAI